MNILKLAGLLLLKFMYYIFSHVVRSACRTFLWGAVIRAVWYVCSMLTRELQDVLMPVGSLQLGHMNVYQSALYICLALLHMTYALDSISHCLSAEMCMWASRYFRFGVQLWNGNIAVSVALLYHVKVNLTLKLTFSIPACVKTILQLFGYCKRWIRK